MKQDKWKSNEANDKSASRVKASGERLFQNIFRVWQNAAVGL